MISNSASSGAMRNSTGQNGAGGGGGGSNSGNSSARMIFQAYTRYEKLYNNNDWNYV